MQKLPRERKIKMLKDLQAGRTTIEDLIGPVIESWYHLDEFYSGGKGLRLNHEQFEAYCRQHQGRNIKLHVYSLQPGNDPLDDGDGGSIKNER